MLVYIVSRLRNQHDRITKKRNEKEVEFASREFIIVFWMQCIQIILTFIEMKRWFQLNAMK